VTAQPDLIRTIVALARDWRDSPDLPYTVDAQQQARCADVLLTMLADGGSEVVRKCVELAYHWRYNHELPCTVEKDQKIHCAGALLILLKDNDVHLPPCASVKHPLTIHPRLGTGGRVLTIPGAQKSHGWMTH
jgi:ATP-dependent protease HslVU (ClpYQ) peptidase subunit